MKEAVLAGLKGLLSSKKFGTFLVGVLATFLSSKVGLPEEAAREIAGQVLVLATTTIGAFGVQDLGKAIGEGLQKAPEKADGTA